MHIAKVLKFAIFIDQGKVDVEVSIWLLKVFYLSDQLVYSLRLERYNYAGCLGLWIAPLYNNFANLLTKYPGNPQDESNTNYTPAAGYHVYKYYVQSMKGPRAVTTGTTSRQFDVFATVGTDQVRMLAGTRTNTGNWTIQVQGLAAVGYPSSGTLHARYYAFYRTDNIFDPIGELPYLGTQLVLIVNRVANPNIYMPDRYTR
ncbi:glycoside hydrolase family 39 protein [Aspergillus undulatus]|uniref:glycoside hydrolase family 39 protein n=1 Tax=Aspergillus undulatus TaxID=1810928 RepID=UPI003CCE06B7